MGIVLGPWRSMSVRFYILPSSFIQCISVSTKRSQNNRRHPCKYNSCSAHLMRVIYGAPAGCTAERKTGNGQGERQRKRNMVLLSAVIWCAQPPPPPTTSPLSCAPLHLVCANVLSTPIICRRLSFYVRQCFCVFYQRLYFSMRQWFAGANVLRYFRLRMIAVVMIMYCVYHDYY
jgi:hypothetical protein